MVVACPSPLRVGNKKTRAIGIPVIDLSVEDSDSNSKSESMVKACQEYGFFKVVNHGIPTHIISRMENEGLDFFKRPASHKHKAGPPTPFGYGVKSIGTHGDTGELEYLLLQANPTDVSHRSLNISPDPLTFRYKCQWLCLEYNAGGENILASAYNRAVNDYMEAVKKLACELLNLLAQGLWGTDPCVFSRLINDPHSDSCFRLNYYPNTMTPQHHPPPVGFGEHTDPQLLTILRSNDVGGLQICSRDGLWIPVPPSPDELCVFVGDALQVMTNGRFEAVRHRVMANTSSTKARLSMIYFGAPSLNGWISPLPHLLSPQIPTQYKSFTWAHYKKAAYSLRLGEPRIDLFKLPHPNSLNHNKLIM